VIHGTYVTIIEKKKKQQRLGFSLSHRDCAERRLDAVKGRAAANTAGRVEAARAVVVAEEDIVTVAVGAENGDLAPLFERQGLFLILEQDN